MKIMTRIMLAGALLLAAPASPARDLDFEKLRGVGEKLAPLRLPSESDEITLGKDIAGKLLGAAPLVNDPALQDYVNKLGLWVALQSERPTLPWHFGVLDTDSVNAFAAPGGYVFITRGMLQRMHDESELAGVLAHEISHVVAKHALIAMRQGKLSGVLGEKLADYAARRSKPEYAKLVSAGTELYVRGLDQKDEFAADRMGVVLAARAGYDPYGLPAVLQTLASLDPKDDAVSLMFKTHPDPEKRLELVTGAMERRLDAYAGQAKLKDRFNLQLNKIPH
jgi:predicted Zn-dependent protease